MKHHKIILSKYFLCILFTLTYFTIQAQNTIKGKVLNEDNEPLLGVNILVKGTDNGTVSDFDGEFTFMDLPEGSTLEIIYIGYESQEISATQNMVVNMKIDKNSLQEVIVTAENRNVSAQKVAITMDLVSGVKLQEMGITDLKQLQNLTPSLAFNQNTFFTQVFIRGVAA